MIRRMLLRNDGCWQNEAFDGNYNCMIVKCVRRQAGSRTFPLLHSASGTCLASGRGSVILKSDGIVRGYVDILTCRPNASQPQA